MRDTARRKDGATGVFAALDLGSNTVRMLAAEVADGSWRALDRGLATPRLGRGLTPGGRLHPAAVQAAREAVGDFTARARELGAGRIALAATQACRVAADGADLVAALGRELGLDSARVLSGLEEAALSRKGVLSRLAGGAGGAWLADIGGGSTELSPLEPGPGREGFSLPLGAVSLTEAHLAHDPPRAGELAAMEAAVDQGLAGPEGLERVAAQGCARLVATAGTAAALAALRLGLADYRPELVDNHQVTAAELESEYRRLAGLSIARRREAMRIDPGRADIILGGLAILKGLAAGLGLNRFVTMDAGLLEGILLHDAAGL